VKRPLRWKAAAIASVMAAAVAAATVPSGFASADSEGAQKHVLLISVDGLHASDLAKCETQHLCPNLASLAGFGTTYSNAKASEPSDSAPGVMALVTGGDPKLTGVYYDDAYDRTVFAPPAQTASLSQDCSGTPGFEAAYFENLDAQAPTFYNPNGSRPIIGATLDTAQMVYQVQKGKCRPLMPNDFLRTNSVFSVAAAAGMHTAWADKHPVYNQEVAGHGTPNAVADPFNTEINADVIPSTLVDTRGNTVTFPLPSPHIITDSVGNTEAYDQIKVDAILNQIDGRNSTATRAAPVPAIFGMNFQTVSVAQKLVDFIKSCDVNPTSTCDHTYFPGGYEPGSTSDNPIFTPQLQGAIQSVDAAIGSMVTELRTKGVLSSTTIILTAKHGQSPVDPAKLKKIGHAESTVLATAGIVSDGTNAQITDDDIALVWLSSQKQGSTQAGVDALNTSKGSGNPANIQTVLHGAALTAQFGDPATDPRTPDIIVEPIPGTIYTHSTAKVAEHGGFALDDTHVALLTVNGANVAANNATGVTVADAVRTYQVAPTILADLGLNPKKLDSVKIENVQVLPTA
jgi:hypothetical protein